MKTPPRSWATRSNSSNRVSQGVQRVVRLLVLLVLLAFAFHVLVPSRTTSISTQAPTGVESPDSEIQQRAGEQGRSDIEVKQGRGAGVAVEPVGAGKGAKEKAKKKGGKRKKGRKVVGKRGDPKVLDLGSVADGVAEDLPIDGLQVAEGEEPPEVEGEQPGGAVDAEESAETGFALSVGVDNTPTGGGSSTDVTPGGGAEGAGDGAGLGMAGGIVPVVTMYAKPPPVLCGADSFVYRGVKAARQRNDAVYLIGPPSCLPLAKEAGVEVELWESYQSTFDKFRKEIGQPKAPHARWYVLLEFMTRHGFETVFYLEPDITLFSNVTEFVHHVLLPEERNVLLMQQGELLDPLPPSQTPPTTRVAAMTALWSRAALEDFVEFHQFWLRRDPLNGRNHPRLLTELPDYSDEVILGWYTHSDCWSLPPPSTGGPKCAAEQRTGIDEKRAARIRGKFWPKFKVYSGMKPRMCVQTAWSDAGWCVFDRDLAVASKSFKYEAGSMKCPTTYHYKYFHEWVGRRERGEDMMQFLSARVGGVMEYHG